MARKRSMPEAQEHLNLIFPSALVEDLDAWATELEAQTFGTVSRSSLIRGILSKAVEEHKASRKQRKK